MTKSQTFHVPPAISFLVQTFSNVHERKKDFLCELCDKSYTQKHHLKRHVEVTHDKIKNFECETCYKIFATKDGLKRHISIIHDDMIKGPKMKVFKCESCEKSFSQKSHLKVHVTTVHEKTKINVQIVK